MPKKKTSKPGPKEDRLRIEGNWREAVKKAIQKPRPAAGWPTAKTSKKPSR